MRWSSAGVNFRKPAEARSKIGCCAFASAQVTGSSTAQASLVGVCRNQNDLECSPARRPLGKKNDAPTAV